MNNFDFNEDEKEYLFLVSRNALKKHFDHCDNECKQLSQCPQQLTNNYGAFVSLYNNSKLRGCLGQFNSSKPLVQLVEELTISSAINDTRFEPIKKVELYDLTVEISILSPLTKISSIDQIQLGKHGIYIKRGYSSGTFLPQVATKTNWNLEEFLGHCSQDKARIGWYGWKNADIYIYEAAVFQSKLIK